MSRRLCTRIIDDLLSAIAGGKKLKKTVTVDKSGVPGAVPQPGAPPPRPPGGGPPPAPPPPPPGGAPADAPRKPNLGGKKSQKGGADEGSGSEFGGPSPDGAIGRACATGSRTGSRTHLRLLLLMLRALRSDLTGTQWISKKPPPSVAGDMFAEMAWQKKQRAAKQEWMEANGKA